MDPVPADRLGFSVGAMITAGASGMIVEGIRFDRPNLKAHLASAATKAKLAKLLRRWTRPRHPAILFVLVGEAPFGDVYAEEELLRIFPNAPIIAAERLGKGATRRLLIFVADEGGTKIYAITDPRGKGSR